MSVKVTNNNPKKSETKPNWKQFVTSFFVWFSIFYLIMTGFNYFFPAEDKNAPAPTGVILNLIDSKLVTGQLAQLELINYTDQTVDFISPCLAEGEGNLKVYAQAIGKEILVTDESFVCNDRKTLPDFSLEAGQTGWYSLGGFNPEIFKSAGDYKIELTLQNQAGETVITQSEYFVYSEPGFFRSIFRAIITEPLFNALVFFINIFPGHSLGLAIIALTIFVRLLLFLPNQKAMKSQRKLQKLQPKIEEIKKNNPGNQQMLAMQTMALYKKEKINPMSSCLPLLLQIPFMIGIYLVVKDGLSPHLSHLLYSFQESVDLSLVQNIFLGLDLAIPNLFILPPLVGIAQFIAIKLSMAKAKKTEPTPSKKKTKKSKNEAPNMMDQMQQMQKFMLYGMPIMITFFTATMPAAVGIYWLTSTVFGIGQQKIVNWQLDKPKVRRKQ